jgi:integrase
VPIVKPLAVLLRRDFMRRGRPDPAALLCPGRKPGGRNSGLLSFEGLQKRVDDIWDPKDENGNLAGNKIGSRITAHECRHTCASWLDAAGVRPVIVSHLMGHATPAHQAGAARITQERYTHALPGEMSHARDLLDRWLAKRAEDPSRGIHESNR